MNYAIDYRNNLHEKFYKDKHDIFEDTPCYSYHEIIKMY